MQMFECGGWIKGEGKGVVELTADKNFLYAMTDDDAIYKYDGEKWEEVKAMPHKKKGKK